MTIAKSYILTIADQFKNVSWISSQQFWITEHGILTDRGMFDHFGPNAVNNAMKVAIKADHLRYDHGNHNVIVFDALGREGLNLAVHPFRLHCLMYTMWRFADDHMTLTLPTYNDAHMFYGWLENIGAAVSKRDGQTYGRPSIMFGDVVHLDH